MEIDSEKEEIITKNTVENIHFLSWLCKSRIASVLSWKSKRNLYNSQCAIMKK